MTFQKNSLDKMKLQKPGTWASFILSSLLAIITPMVAHAIAAFPGAQGGGAASVGGRGGRIIEVTTLADSGPGSFRSCVMASGPRICVFKVAGDIQLKSQIYITSPYLTVAGQTAPGGGIQISGVNMSQNMIGIAAHDVIWQYTKIRKGFTPSNVGEFAPGANMAIDSGSYNMMMDHNSIQWNQDEGFSVFSGDVPVTNVTFSNNLVAEGLYPHSTGYLIGATTSAVNARMTDIDFYQNLTMNNSHRNPLLTNKSSRVINNITYNYAYYAVQAGPNVSMDLIGNKFKYGPVNAPTVREVQLYGSAQSVYMSGNVGHFQPHPDGDQWVMVSQIAGQNATDYGTRAPASSQRLSKLPDTQYPFTVNHVNNIEAIILPQAGASRRLGCDGSWISNRDSVDARLIHQYQTDTGVRILPRSHDDVGGYPVIAAGTPCPDADHDGMPDMWESARGLNPNSASDANADRNFDGYTNIEEYLAGGVVATPAPAPSPSPTPTPTPVPSPAPAPVPTGISNMLATSDATNVMYSFSFSGAPSFLRVYLDTDRNAGTGYAIRGIGANYMIENGNLYKHVGSGTGWSFESAGASNQVKNASSVTFKIARASLGSPVGVNLIGNVDNNAYTAIINQTLPPVIVGTVINMARVSAESGFAFAIYQSFGTAGDKSTAPRQSRLQIYENGRALGAAHAAHVDIRNLGRGRFSHWGNSLRFSASDNTNPKTNGRIYSYKILSAPAP